MDPFARPELVSDSRRRGPGGPLAVAALVTAMVVLAIVGATVWRPPISPRVTLELGGASPAGPLGSGPEDTIARVLEMVSPSVAFLTVPETQRSGSGVVVHESGYILTNAHVIEDARTVTVGFHDGSQYQARVYGVDAATDLAVVKVDDAALVAAALGDSDEMQVGEFVIALGAPFGLETTATSGIVSGLHRSGLGIARYEDFIVTDAPINRGNSGGPLVSLRGEVIGINTAIIAGEEGSPRNRGFAGVGFAIPINVARGVAQRLIGAGLQALPAESSSGDAADGPASGVAFSSAPSSPAVISGARRGHHGWPPQRSVGTIRSLRDGRTVGTGSGFVIAGDSGLLIVTNEHVVRGAEYVQFDVGDDTFIARVLSVDPTMDLALLPVPEHEELPPLTLGDADAVGIGDAVTALGGRGVPSTGEIVSLQAEISLFLGGSLIETTAAIDKGDSGGPLFDAGGIVVGVLVARDSNDPADTNDRRSYAIPLHDHAEVVILLAAADAGNFDPGFTGTGLPGRGFLIDSVAPGGPAADAGLELGDVIVSANGEALSEATAAANWKASLERLPVGAEVAVSIERDESERRIVRRDPGAP